MADKTMVCKNCGKSISAGSSACEHCGQPIERRKSVSRPLVAGCAIIAVIVIAAAIWIGWTAFAFFHESKPNVAAPVVSAPPATLEQGSGISYAVSDVVGGTAADRAKLDGKSVTVSGYVVSVSGTSATLGDTPTAKPADCLAIRGTVSSLKAGSKVKAMGKYDAKSNTLTDATITVAAP